METLVLSVPPIVSILIIASRWSRPWTWTWMVSLYVLPWFSFSILTLTALVFGESMLTWFMAVGVYWLAFIGSFVSVAIYVGCCVVLLRLHDRTNRWMGAIGILSFLFFFMAASSVIFEADHKNAFAVSLPIVIVYPIIFLYGYILVARVSDARINSDIQRIKHPKKSLISLPF